MLLPTIFGCIAAVELMGGAQGVCTPSQCFKSDASLAKIACCSDCCSPGCCCSPTCWSGCCFVSPQGTPPPSPTPTPAPTLAPSLASIRVLRQKIADQAFELAGRKPKGKCGKYVRKAVELALKVKLKRQGSAKDYGPSYVKAGFAVEKTLSASCCSKLKEKQVDIGDIIIFGSFDRHSHGHIQVYTGKEKRGKYVSDFKQRSWYPWKQGFPKHGIIKVYRYFAVH